MRSFLAAGLAAMVTLSTAPASAFCRTTTVPTDPSFSPEPGGCWTEGIFVYHSRACVGYAVEAPGSKKLDMPRFKELAAQAFGTWEAVSCGGKPLSIDAQFTGDTSRSALGYDTRGGPNASAIVFWDDAWPHGSTSEVILTTLTFNKLTGEILDADMEVNTANVSFALADPVPRSGTDMASALAHEVGHFFGIAHSPLREATMFARYTPGSTAFRDLEPDDTEAICSIYLPSGSRATSKGEVPGGACDPSAPPPPTGDTQGGCSARPGAAGDLGLGAVGAVALVLAGALRARRRRAHAR